MFPFDGLLPSLPWRLIYPHLHMRSRSPPDLQEIITLFTMAGRGQQRSYHSPVRVPQSPNSEGQTHTTGSGSWFLVTPSVECACLSLCHTGLSEEYCDYKDCNDYNGEEGAWSPIPLN